MDQKIILFFGVVATVIFIILSKKEKYATSHNNTSTYKKLSEQKYNYSMCELSEGCMWNIGREISLSDGSRGVCTMGGYACPSFF